jgi:hypothetical protein
MLVVMTPASSRTGSEWSVVLARFEQHAPASVMARTALEHAFPADWIDAVFEAECQHKYSRELLFSTVVELMTLVSLGLRPSLHAAARQSGALPVSLASLYGKRCFATRLEGLLGIALICLRQRASSYRYVRH